MDALGNSAAWLVHALNENAGAVQAVATVVLVGVTVWYARKTASLAMDAKRQADEVVRQAEDERRAAGIEAVELVRDFIPALRRLAEGYSQTHRDLLTRARRDGTWTRFMALGARSTPEVRSAVWIAADALDSAWRATGHADRAIRHGDEPKAEAARAAEALQRCIDLARKERG